MKPTAATALFAKLQAILEGGGEDRLLRALDAALDRFDCAVGSIHRLNPESRLLELVVQRGIPDAVLDRVRLIPIGKGMAGLAAERREPVQVCNLQSDDSGQAKPGARATGMEGSIAFPMLDGDELRGAMGVAKPVEYEFTDAERRLLMRVGALLARHL